jgi:hypothetical protein
MKRLIAAALGAVVLGAPALTSAATQPTGSHAPPSSFAPRPHSDRHVYGSPIEPRIVGHARAPVHKHAPTRASGRPTTRDGHSRASQARAAVPVPRAPPG